MAKLTTLKPILRKLPQLIGYPPADEKARSRYRDQTQAYRAWYKTSRWQKLRAATLLRDLYTCGICGCLCTGKGEAVADHRTPHRGDEALFWDAANLWCLCKACHDGAKQRQERGGKALRRVGMDGYPED